MKPTKISKKLYLNKTNVANLEIDEQQKVKGGYLETNCLASCFTWCGPCETREQICGYSAEFTRKLSCF
jgi:hypothetical protein